MRRTLITTVLLLPIALAPAARVDAQTPAGWLLSGEQAERYRMRLDREVFRSGDASLRLEARGNRRNSEWAVAVQMIDATPYRGGRIRLSGHLRSDDVGSGGLWMRVDGILEGEAAQIAIDNAEDRRLEDTNGWTPREIVLEVPPGSVTILYGAMISGDGELWLDDLAVESVPVDTPLTGETTNEVLGGTYLRPRGMLPAPANLGFEMEADGGDGR